MDGHGNSWCAMRSMMFAIKAEVSEPWAETFAFSAQKTMYGGKHIAKGDTIFVFASNVTGIAPYRCVDTGVRFPSPAPAFALKRSGKRRSADHLKRLRSFAPTFLNGDV